MARNRQVKAIASDASRLGQTRREVFVRVGRFAVQTNLATTLAGKDVIIVHWSIKILIHHARHGGRCLCGLGVIEMYGFVTGSIAQDVGCLGGRRRNLGASSIEPPLNFLSLSLSLLLQEKRRQQDRKQVYVEATADKHQVEDGLEIGGHRTLAKSTTIHQGGRGYVR